MSEEDENLPIQAQPPNPSTSIRDNTLQNVQIDGDGDAYIGEKYVVNLARPEVNPYAVLELVDKYRDLPEHDSVFKGLKEELEVYRRPRHERDVVGLEKKLIAGKREDLIDSAKIYKSDANSRLSKYEFSSHATAMHLSVMTRIEEKFNSTILPMIKIGASDQQIDAAISTQIIEPLAQEVSLADITLTPAKIRGLMYLLTGNCYLKWSSE